MSLRKLFSIIFAGATVVAVVSCKKDKETEAYPVLNGTLTFSIPAFIHPNDVLTMTPKGISHPEGKGIGYSWKVTPGMEKSDTTRLDSGLSPDGKPSDGSFTYQFPDSLGTFTVGCYGFAEDYTSSYASSYAITVKGGHNGSIKGTGIFAFDSKINVDGTEYYYVYHNGLDWFRNNLANPSYGVSFSNSDAMLTVFGNYYSYEDAVKACPEGWRLPTDAEWVALANSVNPESKGTVGKPIAKIAADFMGNATFNGSEMWEYWPNVGEITNTSKIAAIPTGYVNLGERSDDGSYPMASFFGIYEYAVFWTADKVEDDENMAYYRYIICDQPDMQIGKGDIKTFGANVRCVRESDGDDGNIIK